MSRKNQDCGCGTVAGATPQKIEPAPFQSSIDYRIGHHGSFIASQLTGFSASTELALFTSRDSSDPAIALLDSWSTVLDILTFYNERIINEGFLYTATERRSLLELGTLIDYQLAPGVSAETYLAFSTDEIPNSPVEVTVPAGAKVQSVPFSIGELPQTFETSADLLARTALNDIRLELALYTAPAPGDTTVYLDVTSARLKAGDALLIVGDERKASPTNRRWQVRRVLAAAVVPENPVSRLPAHAAITLESALDNAARLPDKGIRAFAFRQRASLFGHNAQPWQTLPISLRLGELSPILMSSLVTEPMTGTSLSAAAATIETDAINWVAEDLLLGLELLQTNNTDKDLLVGPFAGRSSTWADANFSDDEPYIYLDQVYDSVVAGGWLVLRKAITGGTDEELYFIEEAAEVSHSDFNLTAKVTRVRLSGAGLSKFSPRNATVYCASEAIAWARKPIESTVSGQHLRLEKPVAELAKDQLISIRGLNESGREVAMIRRIEALATIASKGSAEMQDSVTETTEITLARVLDEPLTRGSVRINGNVVSANHGETRAEPIGSGDASLAFQVLDLSAAPLTFVSAPGGNGRASTLSLRVNDILWQETPDFLHAGTDDRVYRQRIDNNGKVSLTFGDGITGARLASGSNNVSATYRIGTGLAGLLDADRLTQPMTRPVGIRAVTNPLPATGAEDPETLASARRNAPVTVKTLGRIVSLTDYEDFARSFAGIAKAKVTSLWDGSRRLVHLTISGAGGTAFSVEDKTYINLIAAIDAARPRGQPIRVASGETVPVIIDAEIWIHPDYLAETVFAEVRSHLEAAYSFDARDYGEALPASQVIATIQQTPGVNGVRLLQFQRKADASSGNMISELLLAATASFEGGVIRKTELLTLAPEDLTLREISQ